jgi:hypothetical protein
MEFFREGSGVSITKIPLYVGMTATFLEITRRITRFWAKMLWVPFLCIAVNLSFMFFA